MSENKAMMRNFWAGLFFVIGIVLIFFMVFTITKDTGFRQKKFPVVVLFRNIGGLSEGAPVRLSGVNIGNVDAINFLPESVQGRRVEVTIGVFEKFRKQLDGNARFVIKTEGLLGEKLVEIYYVDYGPRLDLSHPVMGEEPLDVQDLAAVFAEAAESFTKTSENFRQIDIKDLSVIMSESSRALLMTSEGINDMISEFKGVTRKSKRVLDRLEQRVIDGNLFRVF